MKYILHSGKFLVLFFISGIFVFSSCQKKEIKGPQGDPGTPGGGGNANLSTTSIFPIATSQWIPDSTAASWNVTIPSTLITKNVVDKGVVKVSVQVDNEWFGLPYINQDLVTQFGFKEGLLYITLTDIHESIKPRPATQTYRMIIISDN